MDGFRLVKLNEVIRQVDIVITCTGQSSGFLQPVDRRVKVAFPPRCIHLYVGENGTKGRPNEGNWT